MTLYQKTFQAIALVSCVASYSSEGNALKGIEWSGNFDASKRAYHVFKLPSAKKHHHRIASVFNHYASNDEAAKSTKAASPEKALKFEHVKRSKKLSPEAREIVTKKIHTRQPTGGLSDLNIQGLRNKKAVAWLPTGKIQGAESERRPLSLRLISRD